MVKIRENHIFI